MGHVLETDVGESVHQIILARADAVHRRGEAQVLPGGELAVQIRLRRQHAEVLAHLVAIPGCSAEDLHLTVGGPGHAGQNTQ